MSQSNKLDPLYDDVKRLVLETRNPSISLIQRHFKISYRRALDLMSALEGDIVIAFHAEGRWKMLKGETVDSVSRKEWASEIEWPTASENVPADCLHLACRCLSQKGVGKITNEDSIMYPDIVQQGYIREFGTIDLSVPRCFAIADGVTSSTKSGFASMHLLSMLNQHMNSADKQTSYRRMLCDIQKEYARLGAHRSNYFGMASTLVGVRFDGTKATIFNVGDSRAYLLTMGAKGCQAQLLTSDHNQLNDMLDAGEITPEQAVTAATIYRGLTSQFIADPEFDEFRSNIVTHELQNGERLLLCSDGLTEVLDDSELAAIFFGNSDEDLMNAFKAARRAGGRDDFSAIVIEISG